MRLYTLLTEIISLLVSTRKKMVKLDDYWGTQHNLTVTTSNPGTGYSITSASAALLNNHMVITIVFKRTGAQVSSGTTINAKLCNLTITGISGLVAVDPDPDDSGVCTSNGTIGGTGPIVTGAIVQFERTNANTFTCVCNLGATAGGVIAQNAELTLRFVVSVCRDMTIS